MNTRTFRENLKAVGTSDRRVVYCYAEIQTETPIKREDVISGLVKDTVWLGEEYKRFTSLEERQAFVDNFDPNTYKAKPLTKRNMRGGEVIEVTGETKATYIYCRKVGQVPRRKR